MARPKIGYLVHSLDPGGTERLALDMALWFSSRYRLQICCLDRPGQWASAARQQGLPVTCLYRRPGIDLRLSVRLAAWIRDTGIDLIHAHQYTPWFYAGLARLLCPGTRLVFQEHGRHYPEVRKPKRILFNRLLLAPLTSGMAAVSEDIRHRLAVYEGLSTERIEVIYNGARPVAPLSRELRQELRRSLGFGSDEVVVASVGRLDPVKNLDLFLDGIAAAAGRVPELKGLIVGDGPEAVRLRDKAGEMGLAGRVVFTGFREDAARLVQAADLLALVSFSEGTSMALLEAMAAGLPAIVTRVGGNPEVVADGRTGWVISSDHLDEFTRALIEAARDGKERAALGQEARRRFSERFEFTAMTRSYDRLYRRILSGKIPWAGAANKAGA